MKRNLLLVFVVLCNFSEIIHAQPSALPDGIRFVYDDVNASSVALVGDFNAWSGLAHPMKKTGSGQWNITVPLLSGSYQYGFLVDNERIQRDPNNPLSYEAIDGSSIRSLITLSAANKLVTEGYPVRLPLADEYPKQGGTVFLNLVIKHHVPLYYNAAKDCIDAPFVRMHATRDYFEMADIIQRYQHVHATAAISPTLLWQIQEIYVKRMEPFIKKNKTMRYKQADMDGNGFLARMRGKTDPWIDVCLTPAEKLSEQDKSLLYRTKWNAFTMSPVRMSRFPELMRLYEKYVDAKGSPDFSVQELRTLKFFSIFGHFDTEFYERNVPLIQTGTRINRSLDLRDLISYRSDGKYYLKREITEDDCRRIVASSWYIMASILPNFDKVKYNPRSMFGQMEIATTSFSDAVLPMLINSDIAKTSDPGITTPPAYVHPEDADAQIKLGIAACQKYFDVTPVGYIPPYGAMSPEVIPLLAKNGLQWFTSSEIVLNNSQPSGLTASAPYGVTVNGSTSYGVFANTLLTNRVNWVYRNYYAENSADDFIRTILSYAPEDKSKDALVTVVIDNDDAWMNYVRDTDGKGLINSIYRKLNKLFETRTIVATTFSEYLTGNRGRGIKPHKPDNFGSITQMSAGSRFDGSFNMWIGSDHSNKAWSELGTTRAALKPIIPDSLNMSFYDTFDASPLSYFYGCTSENWYQVFTSGSVMQTDPKPYEQVYLNMMKDAFTKAGSAAPSSMTSFIPENTVMPVWEKPVMRTRVTFHCKLADREAITSVYVAGNRKELSNMEPNTVRMWDNGENGDEVFGNNVWTLVVDLEPGELLYKYSNSGGQGTWEGSEAFPDVWRKVLIDGEKMTIDDVFTKLK